MPIPYPRTDISARDDNGSESIGFKDANGIFKSVSLQDPLPMYLVNIAQKRRKFVVMAGQSNVFYGANWVRYNTSMPYVSFDPRLKQLGDNTTGEFRDRIIPLGNFAQNNAGDTTYASGWVSKLAELLLDHTDGNIPLIGQYDELIVLQVAIGSTGWTDGRWRPSGTLYQSFLKKIRIMCSEYDADCVGIFWAQWENDSNATMADLHKYYLDNFVANVRDVIANASMNREWADRVPFVTFRLNPEFVTATGANAVTVDNDLASIGTRVPYASSIDITGLPAPVDADTTHYDAPQMVWMADRFYTGWQNARVNNLPVATPWAGEYLLFRQVSGTWLTDALQAIWQPSATPATATLYSILGDLWKYKTSRNTYKFKARFLLQSWVWNEIVFEQLFMPIGHTIDGLPARLISSTGKSLGNAIGGFNGLGWTKSALAPLPTLLNFDTSTGYQGAIGQVTATGTAPNQIPVTGSSAPPANEKVASECELYAIVD